MSAVPPSPAKPTALKSVIPWARKPAAMPASMEAVPANVEIAALQPKHSCGKLKPTALMQPAGSTATARSPKILRIRRTASAPPQPGQALCPKKGSSELIVLGLTLISPLPDPGKTGFMPSCRQIGKDAPQIVL